LIGIEDFDYEVVFLPPKRGYRKMTCYKSDATRSVYEIYDGALAWNLDRA